jgi:hypothetical protein
LISSVSDGYIAAAKSIPNRPVSKDDADAENDAIDRKKRVASAARDVVSAIRDEVAQLQAGGEIPKNVRATVKELADRLLDVKTLAPQAASSFDAAIRQITDSANRAIAGNPVPGQAGPASVLSRKTPPIGTYIDQPTSAVKGASFSIVQNFYGPTDPNKVRTATSQGARDAAYLTGVG